MAQPTNTFSSYDAVGNREDLTDAIYSVDQTKTPFTSAIAKVSAKATQHEWQTDALEAAAENWVIEGDDATTDNRAPTVRLSNYTGISDKVVRVTGSQEAVDAAGRASDLQMHKAKAMMELKRDIEKMALANNAKVAGNDTTAREVAGVMSWIATNTDAGATGADPTGDGTDARTAGTARAFLESQLKTVIASCADAGAEPDKILVGSFNKQAMSGFDGGNTRFDQAASGAINAAVDVYISDFGTLSVEYSPQQDASAALVLDTNLWALAMLPGRAFISTPLAVTGDSKREQVLSEWTLEARNEKGNGGIFDLNVA